MIRLTTEPNVMEPFLVVGLGNPGHTYAANRHNAGFRCVDLLASAHNLSFDRRQKRNRVATGTIRGQRVIVAKPCTFMNDSGRAVVPLARFYRVPAECMLVVYDDIDLAAGAVRLRPHGGSGGHNGVGSIIRHLASGDFPRLRIGVDRPPGRMEPASYVLQDFSDQEEEVLGEQLEHAVAAIETWLSGGIELAMTRYNRGT